MPGQIFALALFLCTWQTSAQHSPLTAGTDFLTTYCDFERMILQNTVPSDYDTNIYHALYLIGVNQACVTVQVAGVGFRQQYFVPKDSILKILLPANPIFPFETQIPRAIGIQSTAPIGVTQATNVGKGGGSSSSSGFVVSQTEAMTLIPNKAFMGINDFYFFSSGSQFTLSNNWATPPNILLVINDETPDSVQVQFGARTTLPPGYAGPFSLPANTVLNYYVNSGEIMCFLVNSYVQEEHNKGLAIKKTSGLLKILSVPVGNALTGNSIGTGFAYEDNKPEGTGGRDFFVAPLAGYLGNQYSIMATKDSTIVSFGSSKTIRLDSLDRFDTCLTGPMHIKASKPIYSYQTPCLDANFNNNAFSAFAVTLSSTEELITESLFSTLDEPDSLNHYVLSAVTKTNAISNFKLNGQQLSNLFAPFPQDSSWSWANVELSKGNYKAQSDSGFHAYQYTWYNDTSKIGLGFVFPSYGYNLSQSIIWPQDSFVFRAGLDSNNLQPFGQTTPTLCPGQSLYLQASHLRHTTWLWQFGDGTTQTQRVGNQRAKPISHTWQSPGQYWVAVTDTAGCSQGDSLLVIVENGPTAAFSYTANTGCSGTFVQLQNESMGATSYQWYWPGGSSTANNPSFVYTGQDTTLEVTLIATDGNCADTATQNIILNPSSFNPQQVPNVFSPNNDGINDAFCIPGATGYQDCYKLEIFNRWGSLVYSAQNPQDCWQPTNIAAGVYFYVLTLGQQKYSGQVTVF